MNISDDPRYHLKLFKDRKKEWRWRLMSVRNGKVVAESGEGYKRKFDCVRMATTLFGADTTAGIKG